MRGCRRLNENDAEAHPNTGTEIETHPKHLFSPVITCLSDPTAHDSVFQALDNAEITQARAFADPPARNIEGISTINIRAAVPAQAIKPIGTHIGGAPAVCCQ